MKRRSSKYDEALIMAVVLAAFGIALAISYVAIWVFNL